MEGIHALRDNGYIQKDDDDNEYPLTVTGELIAEEMFEMMRMLISDQIELPSIVPEIENDTNSELKSKLIKPGTTRKRRLSKYDDAVNRRLDNLKEGVLQSAITHEKMEEELTTRKFAEYFKKMTVGSKSQRLIA